MPYVCFYFIIGQCNEHIASHYIVPRHIESTILGLSYSWNTATSATSYNYIDYWSQTNAVQLLNVVPSTCHWYCWCAILIAHQILWQNMEAPVSIFSGISTCGRTSRESVSHPQRPPLPTLYKISLSAYVIVTNKRLQPLQQPGIIRWCYLFRCWKFNDVELNIGVFCATCIVEGSALSFGDGLQKYSNFKYFTASSYTKSASRFML